MTVLDDRQSPLQRRRSWSRADNDGAAVAPGVWVRAYARRLLVSDGVVLAWALVGAHLVWAANPAWRTKWEPSDPRWLVMSAAVWSTWMIVLALSETRDHRVIGVGVLEYRRIIRSSLAMFGVIAFTAYTLQISAPRSYVLVLMPFGVAFLLLSRWMWREWLHRRQAHGEMTAATIVVGSRGSIGGLVHNLHRHGGAGYRVVGACVPDAVRGTHVDGIEVLGGIDDVADSVREVDASSVIVTSADVTHADMVRELSWSLDERGVELVLAPALTHVVGPRVRTRPIGGVPLLHLDRPSYQGRKRFLKNTFDRVGALVLLIVGLPVVGGVALAVRVTSRGPVIFRQQRIGRNGRSFEMLKFRSMRVGAETELPQLLNEQGRAAQPLFKIADDPRLTRIGGFLRKYSLDELPQLVNVLRGDMSLVGPRPQVPAEVALYQGSAGRRLLVKPGMTGLWQVSGRSDIAWEDAVRLDLFYVENWSITGDLAILARTARAVKSSTGAS